MVAFHPELEPSLVEVAIGEVDEPPSPPPTGATCPALTPPAAAASLIPENSDKAKSAGRPVQRSMSDRYSYRAAIYSMDDPTADL